MGNTKQEISMNQIRLNKKLANILKLICAGLCVVVIGTTAHQVKSEKELNDIISQHEQSELKIYFDGKEVDIEELKKQQEFYRNFGKNQSDRHTKKFQKSDVTYNKKITTKQKKYHRKG